MNLMFREDGFHNFNDDEVESALKDGWVDGEPIRQKLLDAKRGIAKPVEKVTITVQPEVKRSPGRPKRPSILNDGE
jgi:hypothetical protein